MTWIARLIGKSPFRPMVEVQQKVDECAALVPDLMEAVLAEDHARISELARMISTLEHEVDQIKTSMRDQLPKSMFMQVSRPDLLNVIAAQDAIADAAEDLGVLVTMRPMERPPDEVQELLREHVTSVLAVVEKSSAVVGKLETLAGHSFGGPEAQRVLGLIDLVDREEHEADKVQDRLAKALFRHEDAFKPAALFMWSKIFNKIGDLANFAEKMTHRIRLFMAS